jgi:hypothetical protein
MFLSDLASSRENLFTNQASQCLRRGEPRLEQNRSVIFSACPPVCKSANMQISLNPIILFNITIKISEIRFKICEISGKSFK